MQATGKINATATKINATGDATKINVVATKIDAAATKIDVTTATTLTSLASSEVASLEMTSSSEKMATGLTAGEIN